MTLPRRRDAHRVEPGAFEQYVGRVLVDARAFAADDTAQTDRSALVSDDAILRRRLIFLAVERQELVALAATPCGDVPGQLGDVIDVKWPRLVDREVIRDIDQGGDRPQPDRLQPLLKPLRALAVANAADHPAPEDVTAGIRLDGDLRFGLERSFDDGVGHRLEPADSRRRKVAGDPVDAHAVRAVRSDVHVEDGIVQAGIVRKDRSDRRVLRELDDSVMLLAELELADGAHHAAALDSADCGDLQRQIRAGDVGSRPAEHAQHSGAGVGSAADDLDRLAGAGIDGEDLELVRLRMLFGCEHPGHPERRQCLGRVHDLLDLEADRGQRFGDRRRIGVRLQMVLEPAQRELHAPTPPDRVGTSRARKP